MGVVGGGWHRGWGCRARVAPRRRGGGGFGVEGAAARWRGRGVEEDGVRPGSVAEKESERRGCGLAARRGRGRAPGVSYGRRSRATMRASDRSDSSWKCRLEGVAVNFKGEAGVRWCTERGGARGWRWGRQRGTAGRRRVGGAWVRVGDDSDDEARSETEMMRPGPVRCLRRVRHRRQSRGWGGIWGREETDRVAREVGDGGVDRRWRA